MLFLRCPPRIDETERGRGSLKLLLLTTTTTTTSNIGAIYVISYRCNNDMLYHLKNKYLTQQQTSYQQHGLEPGGVVKPMTVRLFIFSMEHK